MAHFPHHELTFVFGLLGNIVSFMVFLAPVPTFYRIIKKKSTEGFQSIPYSVALFSAMLLLYYAYLKTNAIFLITINSIGCFIESVYLIIYMIYATKGSRIYTTKLLVLFNFGAYGLILVITYLVWHGPKRVSIVGWICAAFSVSVFAAPLSIMRRVVKTKSVEYMPLSLSFFLTLCAVMWFFYGLLLKDYYIATPNILGFTFGITQMILYAIYKDAKKESVLPESKVEELTNDIQLSKGGENKEQLKGAAEEADDGKQVLGTIQDISIGTNRSVLQIKDANGVQVIVVEIPENSTVTIMNKEEEGAEAPKDQQGVHGTSVLQPTDQSHV